MMKVIFVGGTAYSGSTLLDMILANSPQGFSCGEVYAIFHPFRRHHLEFVCGCGVKDCSVWPVVKRAGVSRFYQTLFERNPAVQYIVDSSKDPLWIRDRTRELLDSGIEVKNVLIWKTPQEFLHSRMKRGEEKGWRRAWVNYHRLYFGLIEDWIGVPYAQLATSSAVLRTLCMSLGIAYFEGKERYWEKVHHTLFGNTSAKIHLYSKKSAGYEECKTTLSSRIKVSDDLQDRGTRHQQIYYEQPSLARSFEEVASSHADQALQSIHALLKTRDILTDPNERTQEALESNTGDLIFAELWALIHKLKRPVQTLALNLYEKTTKY